MEFVIVMDIPMVFSAAGAGDQSMGYKGQRVLCTRNARCKEGYITRGVHSTVYQKNKDTTKFTFVNSEMV